MTSIYQIYGGNEGSVPEVERASGSPDLNAFASSGSIVFWLAVLGILVVMRVAYEALD